MGKSLLAMFHGLGEMGYSGSSSDVALHDEEKERREGAEATVANLKKIIADINAAQLFDPSLKNKKLFTKEKETAQKLIRDVADVAISYYDLANKITHFRKKFGTMEPTDYKREQDRLETNRTNRHNALIDAVNIANRYITAHFGKMSADDLGNYQEKEEAAGREPLDVKRIDLPPNGICTNEVNLTDRTSISRWALQLAQILEEIKTSGGKDIF